MEDGTGANAGTIQLQRSPTVSALNVHTANFKDIINWIVSVKGLLIQNNAGQKDLIDCANKILSDSAKRGDALAAPILSTAQNNSVAINDFTTCGKIVDCHRIIFSTAVLPQDSSDNAENKNLKAVSLLRSLHTVLQTD